MVPFHSKEPAGSDTQGPPPARLARRSRDAFASFVSRAAGIPAAIAFSTSCALSVPTCSNTSKARIARSRSVPSSSRPGLFLFGGDNFKGRSPSFRFGGHHTTKADIAVTDRRETGDAVPATQIAQVVEPRTTPQRPRPCRVQVFPSVGPEVGISPGTAAAPLADVAGHVKQPERVGRVTRRRFGSPRRQFLVRWGFLRLAVVAEGVEGLIT